MELMKNEILQLDQPDLDFGIYRVLNSRREEIERYFDEELPTLLEEVAGQEGAVRRTELESTVAALREKLEDSATGLGLASAFDGGVLHDMLASLPLGKDYVSALEDLERFDAESPFAESELDRLYNQLYVFFRRYYRDGDFEPQPRRAQAARYSVPYGGEDVHFYWRSFGSHYIKTVEELRSYQFSAGKQVVRFELVTAYEEPDNVKGTSRYFVPVVADCEQRLVPGSPPAFVIPFAFRRLTADEEKRYAARSEELDGATVQDRIVADLGEKIPAPSGIAKSELVRHMRRYTARARRDYFVHPRLGEFLQAEFDYFLKNEVLDIHGMTSAGAVADRLRKVRVLRDVASSVISLLSDLEVTQALLFEKGRFVLATDYLIRLDLVPEDLWPTLLEQEALVASWQDVLGSDRTVDETLLKSIPSLVVDTSLVAPEVSRAALAGIFDVEGTVDGLVISGDNYGALRTLLPSMREGVDLVYNDPPYNTGSDGFPYKDDFARHSTWLSMLAERTNLCRTLLAPDGVLIQSIDENEHIHASLLLTLLFGERNRVADIVWKNSSKNDQAYVSVQHEYVIGAVKDKSANKGEWIELKEGLEEIYAAFDRFHREHGDDWEAIHAAALEFYRTLPPGHPARDHKHYNWMDSRGVYFASDISGPNFGQYRYDVLHPVTKKVCKEPASGWRFPQETMEERIRKDLVHFGPDHTTVPKNKTYLADTEAQSLTSVKYRDGRVGSKALENVLGHRAFDNPKDPGLLSQIFGAIVPESATVLDAFAGSGSTGQAVIELNRRHKTRRRFVLIELDDRTVDEVVIPRLSRLMLTGEWVNGIPRIDEAPPLLGAESGDDGSPKLVKVLRLERFDDVLNSLAAPDDTGAEAQERLDIERPLAYVPELAAASAVTLNTQQLEHPFEYTLSVHGETGTRQVAVDLAETFRLLAGIRLTSSRLTKDGDRTYLLESGTQGEDRVLVVWRNVEGLDPVQEHSFLDEEVPKLFGTSLSTFSRIWHNADCAVPSGQSLDAEFRRLMFGTGPGLT
jgi:adenine-specific DNA-methyltransferase